jgi:hypothetical protein
VGNINDRGEISINGWDGSNNHSVVLIPCDENHLDVEGCDYSTIDAETAAAQSAARPHFPRATKLPARSPLGNRLRIPGQHSPGK